MPTHTRLRGRDDYHDSGLSETLEANFYHLLNWAFAEMGAYGVVERAASGWYAGDYSRLRLGEDPAYSGGRVWQGFRSNWVWETGVERSPGPVRVSGVHVDGTFYGLATTGAYSYRVDYPNGQIIFDTAISPSSVVQANFTYRYVNVVTSDDRKWREFHTHSMRADDAHFLQYGSGAWSTNPDNRLQLPAVVVHATSNVDVAGRQLGTAAPVKRQVVHFYVVAETDYDARKLHDILTDQYARRFNLFDVDRLLAATGFPLDLYGSPVPSAKEYPDMVKPFTEGGYGYNQVRVEGVSSAELSSEYKGLESCLVRWVCEVDMV